MSRENGSCSARSPSSTTSSGRRTRTASSTTIMSFGELAAGDAALEIGAGTGKATMKVVERGLLVHALEPSPEMAALLRAKGVEIEETTFEEWPVRAGAYRLVYAAQAWHWVGGDDRYERAAATLAPGGTLAIIWNAAAGVRGRARRGRSTRSTTGSRPRCAAAHRTGGDSTRRSTRSRAVRNSARPSSARSRGRRPYTTRRVRPAHRDAVRPPRPPRRPAHADPRRGRQR